MPQKIAISQYFLMLVQVKRSQRVVAVVSNKTYLLE